MPRMVSDAVDIPPSSRQRASDLFGPLLNDGFRLVFFKIECKGNLSESGIRVKGYAAGIGRTSIMRVVESGLIFDARQAPLHRRFCWFTSALVLSNGRIVVAFRTGSAKDGPDGNIMIRMSKDSGRTWVSVFEGFDPKVDGVSGEWRAGFLAELKPGRLIGTAVNVRTTRVRTKSQTRS